MRNLEKVKFIVKEATGLDIAYAYDDLVFSEHGVFMIQWDNIIENQLYCYFHKDCITDDMMQMIENQLSLCLQNLQRRKE